MKRVGDLVCKSKTQDQKKAVRSAVAKFKRRGRKPYPNGLSMIRVSIKGRYFQYSAISGKWSYAKSIGKDYWRSSESIDEFIEKAEKMVNWINEN